MFPKHSKLEKLFAANSQLYDLHTENLMSVKQMDIFECRIQSIDLSHLKNLELIRHAYNQDVKVNRNVKKYDDGDNII